MKLLLILLIYFLIEWVVIFGTDYGLDETTHRTVEIWGGSLINRVGW